MQLCNAPSPQICYILCWVFCCTKISSPSFRQTFRRMMPLASLLPVCNLFSCSSRATPRLRRVSQCSSAYAAYGFFATTSRTSSHTLYSYRSYILIHDIYRQSHKYSTMLHYIVRVIHASATSSLHLHWVWSLFYAYYPLSDMFWCTPKLQTLIRASMS